MLLLVSVDEYKSSIEKQHVLLRPTVFFTSTFSHTFSVHSSKNAKLASMSDTNDLSSMNLINI